jgi:phage regulator Rha-like protein
MEIALPEVCEKLGMHICDGDIPVIGSLAIADFVEKRHDNVLHAIENHITHIKQGVVQGVAALDLRAPPGFSIAEGLRWFRLTGYHDAQGKFRKAYDLERPAALYTISSYDGPKVAVFKVVLFQAFELAIQTIKQMKAGGYLPNGVLPFGYSSRAADLLNLQPRPALKPLGTLIAEHFDPAEALFALTRQWNSPARHEMSPADREALKELRQTLSQLVSLTGNLMRPAPAPVIEHDDENDDGELDEADE